MTEVGANDSLVSIVLPVYNAEIYIEKTIKSVLCQTYKNFELIIIDDFSLDKSYDICNKMCDFDIRIRLFRNEQNEGLCKARNKGIQLAKGDFITFIDHDDIVDKDFLSDNVKIMILRDVDWVKFGHVDYMFQNNICLKKKVQAFQKEIYVKEYIYSQILSLQMKGLFIYVWDSLFKTSIIKKNNIKFDQNFKYGNEDIDFCLEYCKYIKKMAVNDKYYYFHYMRFDLSTSSKFALEKLESYCYLGKKLNEKYKFMNLKIQKQSTLYNCLMTNLILFNICQDLNRKSNHMSYFRKKKMLKLLLDNSVLHNNMNVNWIQFYNLSFKMFCYFFLYKIRCFGGLLFLDKYTRNVVYFYRIKRNKYISRKEDN